MARARFKDLVLNEANGMPLDSIQVDVYQTGTTTPISETIYSAATGASTLTNPFTANNGEIEFFLDAADRVDVKYSVSGFTAETKVVDVLPPADEIAELDKAQTFTGANVYTGSLEIPEYAKASLPAAAAAGRIARVTDNTRGVWMDQGSQWFSLSGEVIDAREFGAKGDGTDVTTQLQAALDACPAGGAVFLPADETLADNQTIYGVTAPLRIAGSRKLFSIGRSGGSNGVTIKALAGFTGAAVITDSNWAVNSGDWWHWGSIENIVIDCDNVADVGIAIHQLGEESLLRRVAVNDAVSAGFLLTGAHAPATLELCSAWNCPIGFKFTSHPDVATLTAKTGNGGVVRLFGPSGDSTVASSKHFFFDGSQKVTAVGIKSESWPIGLRWEGSSTGGAAGTALLSGFFNATAQTNLIEIGGTATPILVLQALHSSGYTNIINDTVQTKTVPVSHLNQLLGSLVWNGSTLFGGAQFVMDKEKQISWRRSSTGAVVAIFALNSGDKVEHRDFNGTLRMALNGAALELQEATNISTGTTTGTKIGTATSQKIGFFNATPIVQPAANADTSGATLGELETEVNQLKQTLRDLGLLAT